MRRTDWLAGALLGLAACGGPVPPWPEPPTTQLDLRLSVAQKEVPLLGTLTAQLDLFRAADLAVEFDAKVVGEDFVARLLDDREQPLGHGVWRHLSFALSPLRGPGELALPSFSARSADGKLVATTAEQFVFVTSLLAERDAQIEAPSDPLLPLDPKWREGLLVALVLLALGGVVWWGRYRTVGMPQTVPTPSHVIALRELARLRSAPRASAAEIEQFYVAVSNVLREYITRRFGLRAPERTTEEFLRELDSGDSPVRLHRGALARFLSQCDFVKFAGQLPAAAVHDATLELAAEFVQQTLPQAEVP